MDCEFLKFIEFPLFPPQRRIDKKQKRNTNRKWIRKNFTSVAEKGGAIIWLELFSITKFYLKSLEKWNILISKVRRRNRELIDKRILGKTIFLQNPVLQLSHHLFENCNLSTNILNSLKITDYFFRIMFRIHCRGKYAPVDTPWHLFEIFGNLCLRRKNPEKC